VQANLRDLVRTASALPPAAPQGILLTPKVLAVGVAILAVVVALMVGLLLSH
jgi:hypothetical protein